MKNGVFIIAEIGINHNGDLNIAKQMIDMAKECGCDAVKFQKRTIGVVYTKAYLDQPRESPWGTTQRDQKVGLEFGKKEYNAIDKYCKKLKIDWFASAWDMNSLLFLSEYKLKYNKVASAMADKLDFLKLVAKQGKHTFISTGTVLSGSIDQAVAIFKKADCPFTLLHCIPKYPCPDELTNLGMIPRLKEKYGCQVGFSNHNPSILAPALAVAMGAEAIEVHITLDRTLYGSDQAASFEKGGLEKVVRDCHRVRGMM